jgi:hypothetical protein
LMASTALTPTQHKGGIGAIIGIVAAIAIPFAAPIIASSMMVSMGIAASATALSATAMTIGSAIVGGALGAGLAAITGGNVAMGAIGGAISGGISGFAEAGTAGGAISGAEANAFMGPGGGGSVGLPSTLPVTSPVSPAGLGPPKLVTDSAGNTFIQPATSVGSDAGSTLSGGAISGAEANAFMGPGNPMGVGSVGLPSTISPTFIDKAANFIGDLPNKLMSSEALQQVAGQAITTGVGNAMVGEPNMTNEEKARMADLEQARAFQKGQLAKKQAVSDSYLQQAASTNPEYYGQQALTEEQNRLNRAQQAGLRNIRPSATGQRAAQVQRNALQKSRLSGFDRGRQEAESKRLHYMQAAQSSAPTGAGYAGNIAGDLKAADLRYKRSEKEYNDYAGILEPLAADIFSVDSAAEREKKRKEATGE